MLRIRRLKIENYGGISDRDIELENGLNVIYGKNESGKSTMRSFIHAMFYGLKNSSEKADRKKYMPWHGGNMSGRLELERDGHKLEIRRTFGKTASSDKFSVNDAVSGEAIDGIASSEAGEALIGVSENIFVKTAYVKQGGAVTEGADDEITARLINLASSGDEDVSAERALGAVERAKRRLKAKNKTYSPGVTDSLNERKNKLLEERYAAVRLSREVGSKRRDLMELQDREKTVVAEINKVQKLQKRQSDMAEIKEASLLERLDREIEELRENPVLKRFEGFSDEQSGNMESKSDRLAALSDMKAEKQRLSELEAAAAETSSSGSKLIFIGEFCIIAALVLFGIITCGIASYILYVAGAVCALLSIVYFIAVRRRIKESEIERNRLLLEKSELQSQIDAAEAERAALRKELDGELERLGVSSVEECRRKYREYIKLKSSLETAETHYKDVLDGRDAEAVISRARELRREIEGMEEEISRAPQLLDKLTAERNVLDQKIRKCTFEIENAPMASVSDIECELKTIDEELDMFGVRLEALEIAGNELNAAFEEVRGSFGTVLNNEINTQLEKITGGKYTEAKVSNDYKIRLLCSDGSLQEGSALSSGTYEQIYLALRLGIAKLICGDNIVIITDDICAQYDDERAENAIKVLKENSERVQILMFTCHERDLRSAERIGGINIIKI